MFDTRTFTYSRVGYANKVEKEALMVESIRKQVDGMKEVRLSLVESNPIDTLLTEKGVRHETMAPFRQLKSDMNTRFSTLDEFFN